MTKHIDLLLLVLVPGLMTGCLTTQSTTPATNPTQTVSYSLPVLTPVEPDKQIQEKDGIRVSVAPYTFSTRDVVQREYRRKPAILIMNNEYPVDVRTTPQVQVNPDNIVFKVKINNQLERVLRLAGTVVAFQVAGKQVAVDQSKYQEFQNAIILPRQEGEYDVGGPALSTLPDNATVALFLYDIVTETDAAGNPTKRSNFEFLYALSRQRRTKEADAGITSTYVNERDATMLMQHEKQQGLSPGDWIKVP